MMREPDARTPQSGPSPGKGEDRWGLTPPSHPSKATFTHTRVRTARARRLRANMTDAERKLWSVLRGGQMGPSFRRQHPIGNYVADFWCADARLVVEVDGGQHGLAREVIRDARRSDALARQGIKVIRFWNNDVLNNIDGVWQLIAAEVAERAGSTPTPALPLSGGGGDQPLNSQSGSSPGQGEDRLGVTPRNLPGAAP